MNPTATLSLEDQIIKLRQLVNVLNKKHQESLLALSHKESELNETGKQLQGYKDQAQHALADASSFKQKLEEVLQEFETYKMRFGDHQSHATDAEDEVVALRQQHMQLIEKLKNTEDRTSNLETELENAKQKEQQLERVIQFLRQRGEESHLEIGEIEQELQTAKATQHSLNEEIENDRRIIQDLNSALEEEKHKNEKLTSGLKQEQPTLYMDQIQELHTAKLNAERKIAELQSLLENKEKHIQEFHARTEPHHFNTEDLKAPQDDLQSRLRMLQTHLAKKVRETTVLMEKIEEQKNQTLEIQTILTSSKARSSELESTLELERQHHLKLQSQLEESLKVAEGQMLRWEEKYTKIYDKWQEKEHLNKDSRHLEDKLLQIQTHVANLNALLGIGTYPILMQDESDPHDHLFIYSE